LSFAAKCPPEYPSGGHFYSVPKKIAETPAFPLAKIGKIV
jgi:hypothetical protein